MAKIKISFKKGSLKLTGIFNRDLHTLNTQNHWATAILTASLICVLYKWILKPNYTYIRSIYLCLERFMNSKSIYFIRVF